MARRSPSRRAIEIELFPFLSVLACTIGTLILLIIVLATNLFTGEREVTIVAKNEAGEQGNNQKKTPRYIECRQDGIVIHPSQEFVAKKDLKKPNTALTKLINDVKNNRDREYLIAAIRPDGIEVFQQVRNLIEQERIDLGYEPIEKDWKLKIE
jgi:biopolymer transport protein ExbD